MFKFRVVVFDLTYCAKEWIEKFCNEEHMEVCEYITMDDESPMQITELPQYDNWDLLFVFETDLRDMVNELLYKLSIPSERIIYPFDFDESVAENYDIYMYLFKGLAYRLARYASFRENGEKYVVAATDDLYFINSSDDEVILKGTYLSCDTVWSQEIMKDFYGLSREYYRFLDKQDIFCDIGANIGTTCIYFKKILDKNTSILAFEPSGENYKMLQINAILNDISIIDNRFVPLGLSDKKTESWFNYDPSNPGGSSVINKETEEAERIILTTFDDYISENGIDPERIKYFWVDVEGFEARFLKGAEKTLSIVNVPFIMEFAPRFYLHKDGEFELLMNELGKHFKSFICIQCPEIGIQPIERLWDKQNMEELSWDIFLLKN